MKILEKHWTKHAQFVCVYVNLTQFINDLVQKDASYFQWQLNRKIKYIKLPL
jgi:hypothetical protein